MRAIEVWEPVGFSPQLGLVNGKPRELLKSTLRPVEHDMHLIHIDNQQTNLPSTRANLFSPVQSQLSRGPVPSMMMGPIPIQSVPPSTNPLYGNQFGNGLFPSNPFQWSMGGLGSGSPTSQLTLPPLPPIGAISSASSTPSTGLEFAPVSMTSANRTTSQRSDPTNLLNGLSNGNKLPDDVKPDTLVKELLVWSQTMSQLQQTQKSQGTAENHPIHCMTQSKSTELMEGVVVASPVDEFSQSDCYDGGSGGDPNSVKSSTNPIRKYGSFEECSSIKCQSAGMREHYHCQSCEKIIVRREEMIRHAKWHRKREESLQYGFMRYSPGDNCAVTGCAHNGRQTHYHCLQPNCTKLARMRAPRPLPPPPFISVANCPGWKVGVSEVTTHDGCTSVTERLFLQCDDDDDDDDKTKPGVYDRGTSAVDQK
ncbi:unnamed protein product [Echinostoma caproni]|uniref:C2H2-type domain-containing protein n=1 Tax=Echinostoma caproni TaxID=27848 RepID=A0A183A6B9_9TREM|nr:unnamed protein product [Echinostoma caproni]